MDSMANDEKRQAQRLITTIRAVSPYRTISQLAMLLRCSKRNVYKLLRGDVKAGRQVLAKLIAAERLLQFPQSVKTSENITWLRDAMLDCETQVEVKSKVRSMTIALGDGIVPETHILHFLRGICHLDLASVNGAWDRIHLKKAKDDFGMAIRDIHTFYGVHQTNDHWINECRELLPALRDKNRFRHFFSRVYLEIKRATKQTHDARSRAEAKTWLALVAKNYFWADYLTERYVIADDRMPDKGLLAATHHFLRLAAVEMQEPIHFYHCLDISTILEETDIVWDDFMYFTTSVNGRSKSVVNLELKRLEGFSFLEKLVCYTDWLNDNDETDDGIDDDE